MRHSGRLPKQHGGILINGLPAQLSFVFNKILASFFQFSKNVLLLPPSRQDFLSAARPGRFTLRPKAFVATDREPPLCGHFRKRLAPGDSSAASHFPPAVAASQLQCITLAYLLGAVKLRLLVS